MKWSGRKNRIPSPVSQKDPGVSLWDGSCDFRTIWSRKASVEDPIGSVRELQVTYPMGPSTNILRTLGFYIGDHEYALSQVLVI